MSLSSHHFTLDPFQEPQSLLQEIVLFFHIPKCQLLPPCGGSDINHPFRGLSMFRQKSSPSFHKSFESGRSRHWNVLPLPPLCLHRHPQKSTISPNSGSNFLTSSQVSVCLLLLYTKKRRLSSTKTWSDRKKPCRNMKVQFAELKLLGQNGLYTTVQETSENPMESTNDCLCYQFHTTTCQPNQETHQSDQIVCVPQSV